MLKCSWSTDRTHAHLVQTCSRSQEESQNSPTITSCGDRSSGRSMVTAQDFKILSHTDSYFDAAQAQVNSIYRSKHASIASSTRKWDIAAFGMRFISNAGKQKHLKRHFFWRKLLKNIILIYVKPTKDPIYLGFFLVFCGLLDQMCFADRGYKDIYKACWFILLSRLEFNVKATSRGQTTHNRVNVQQTNRCNRQNNRRSQKPKSHLHFSCVPGIFQPVVVLLQSLVHIDAGGQQSRQILHGRTSRDLQGPFSQTAHHGERRPAARLHKAWSHLEEGAVTARHRQR